jgi:protein-tyrosine phosphatase
LLAARGVDPGGFAARQLQPPQLRSADLVLTMTTEQRSAVVTRAPAAVRRTFALCEFADLARLGGAAIDHRHPADRLAALVAAAPRLRALRSGPRDDDVEDPYGCPDDVFARAFSRIEVAVDALLGVVDPRRAHTASPEATTVLQVSYARSGG